MILTITTLPPLKISRVPLDTGRENVAVMSRRAHALRPEGFRAFSRVEISGDGKTILATLLITDDDELVKPDALGLADPAFRRLGSREGEPVTIVPALEPASLQAVRAKIGGKVLSAADIRNIVRDIAQYRYADIDLAAFLVGAANSITTEELLALTREMAEAGTMLKWDKPMIVDKHCIGGIPGNRTTMVVTPIVAAHGLTIPKTSSRSITSPAGTADTMEVLARVDLSIDHMKEVVKACNGCIVWGGHVNLSPADDVLVSIERRLNIDTGEQMVASIISKKLAAGSTHVLVDIPVGPTAKIRHGVDAQRLKKLFEFIGGNLGINLEVITTDGRQPIGRGIGPVLEARDVMKVLGNEKDAPQDLREKSLRLAGRVLEYDLNLRGGAGYARAKELLENGAALKTMQKIIEAQGPTLCKNQMGGLAKDILAERDGFVTDIDCLHFNRVGRLAGAPLDNGAGIDLFKKTGDRVEKGEPLYRIYSCAASEFDLAVATAQEQSGYSIGSERAEATEALL
jgi:thymidine phosphorylase